MSEVALATASNEVRKPDEVDIHVGARLRARRRAIGMSQEALAARVGLTFQQVQKYERGTNRISASKLFYMAQALGVPVAYLYEGLQEDVTKPVADPQALFFAEPGADKVAAAYLRAPESIRRGVSALLRETVPEPTP